MRYGVNRGVLAVLAPAALLIGASVAQAQSACPGPGVQPRPGPSTITVSADGMTTYISTAGPIFPESDTFGPNPANLLPTVYENMCDSGGDEIPNTLPSTPEHPYNLHPDPVVTPIDKTSPTDDINMVLRHLRDAIDQDDDDDDHHGRSRGHADHRLIDMDKIQLAIDVLEGNPLNRAYSGMPLLHYNGPNKTKVVEPIMEGDQVVGGTVTVHQVWYDSHIESDTSYIDPSAVLDVPWTIRYVVDVLNRGHDDFAPYAMFFDDPQDVGMPMPNVGMDQTFFPMEEGLRFVFEMKMPPGRFWNLTYHWGWRVHPPRVQVAENVLIPLGGMPRNTFEIKVFGENPTSSETAKLAAIDMIGDLSPAKRMWKAFRAIKAGARGRNLIRLIDEAQDAFDDWSNRNELPSGVEQDPDADVTVLYVNNTMYGHIKGYVRDSQMEMTKWHKRGDKVKVKLLNADYYVHTYVLVDFGGLRGWENTFHNTLPIGGAGPWFTFGRNHFWIHTTSGPVMVPAAERPTETPGPVFGLNEVRKMGEGKESSPDWLKISKSFSADTKTITGLGEHNVEVTFNYEPTPRLRMYQFDAFHHDVAVWSMH